MTTTRPPRPWAYLSSGRRRPFYTALAVMGGICIMQRTTLFQHLSPQVNTVVFSTTSAAGSESPSSMSLRGADMSQGGDVVETGGNYQAQGDHADVNSPSQEETLPMASAIASGASPSPRTGACKEPSASISSCLDRFLDLPIKLSESRAARGVIETTSGGQFGNQAFLIAFAAILARKLDYDVRLKESWDYVPWTVGKDTTPLGGCKSWTTINDDNFCAELSSLRQKVMDDGHCIRLQDAYLQRFSLFASNMDYVREVLASPDCPNHESPGPDDLVVHIRFLGRRPRVYNDVPLATVEQVQKADFYGQLDPEYYDRIIESRSYDKVWVVCDEDTRAAPLVGYLAKKHGAIIQSRRGWWEDYTFLSNANRIVLPISTFSWWAALLNNATEVHFPLAALWHPSNPHHLQTFDSDLAGSLTVYGPGDDNRYIYHDLVKRAWFGKYDACTNDFVFKERSVEAQVVADER